jgi:peptide/nickel transport system permease protein
MFGTKRLRSVVRNGIRKDSQLDLTIRRFRRNKLAVIGLGITLVYILVGALGPMITPYNPTAIDVPNAYAAPTLAHPFGTDQLGRDLLSRVILGAQISLKVATASIGFATVAGLSLGLTAGYYRGIVDEVIMRIMDVLFAFPSILLALVIIATMGPGLDKAIIALAIVYTPIMARIARGSAASVREEEYVMAARSYGEGSFGIMTRDVLPNMLAPVMVQATISFAFAILAEAALSYLGLGAQPPNPSWGIIITQGQQVMEQAPWVALFPGLAIMTTVMGLNFLGDGLRDALDPKMEGEIEGRT